MNKISLIVAGTLLISSASLIHADVISIAEPSYSTPNSAEGVLRPTQGMTMNKVEQEYGTAENQSGPVGEPPITTWTYPNFLVFFEDNIVIHSVISR
ncbi:MAG: hypothetical protein GQ548_07475 [Methylophaga sp.]|nr:hypothetical protein [Methylophaga sp.]